MIYIIIQHYTQCNIVDWEEEALPGPGNLRRETDRLGSTRIDSDRTQIGIESRETGGGSRNWKDTATATAADIIIIIIIMYRAVAL